MGGEAKTHLRVWSLVLASLCYCYFIASKIPKGKLRLIFFLPTFIIFTFLPLYFSSGISAGLISFFITYLGNFKLLLFVYNIGPLSDSQNECNQIRNPEKHGLTYWPRKSPLFRFIMLAILPIKIKDPSTKNDQKPKKTLPLNIWSKALCFSILQAICNTYISQLHSILVWIIYCCMMYLFLDVIMGLCNKVVGTIMGVDLQPPSDEPYLSTSLQDFWGRRWNLMVTDVLRHTIYLPMKIFLSKYISQHRVVIPSVMTVFLVSGLMHELIFYYLTRVSSTWEVTQFFVINGICVIIEWHMKKYLRHKLELHWTISCSLTLSFVMGTGYFWFFRPLLRNQDNIGMAKEATTLYEFIRRFAIIVGQHEYV